MLPQRQKEKIKQFTEIVWGRIFGLQEGGFSNHGIAAVCSGTIPQWCRSLEAVERRTIRKTGSLRRRVTLARDDR